MVKNIYLRKKSMKTLQILLLTGTFISFSCCTNVQNEQTTESDLTINDTATYTNPIMSKYLADPCVMFDKGYYYLFATGAAEDGRKIPIHRTKNFVNWEFIRGAVEGGEETDWNFKHFWAPEVIKIDGKWHLYYTASPKISPKNSGNHVGLAVSENIEGPYENKGRVIPHASIDGHVYIEGDDMYMFYTIEHLNEDSLKPGKIYMDKMLAPDKVAGEYQPIITHHPWQEGPFLQKRNSKYFLTYSCGAWINETYHLRYAIADSPEGFFEEQPDTILCSNEMVKGPGHHFMYSNREGKDWIVYHGWDTAHTGRYPRIDRIFFEGDKISSDGPTFTEQRLDK